MDLKLHANATTTPRTRAYIQKSSATNSAPARELTAVLREAQVKYFTRRRQCLQPS